MLTFNSEFTPVLSISNQREDYISIDLSVNNIELAHHLHKSSTSENWEIYMTSFLESNSKKVAYGGYLEHRFLYERSNHFTKVSSENKRNIHLGIDLWCPAGTGVLAPLNGVVHSFANNTNHGDYGPTIILKHTVEQTIFYSLYGHLSVDSITHITLNQPISKGEEFAVLGTSSVNGDYAPHLHFQLIHDIQSNLGDYPGVSSSKKLPFYQKNCPDPNLILNI